MLLQNFWAEVQQNNISIFSAHFLSDPEFRELEAVVYTNIVFLENELNSSNKGNILLKIKTKLKSA